MKKYFTFNEENLKEIIQKDPAMADRLKPITKDGVELEEKLENAGVGELLHSGKGEFYIGEIYGDDELEVFGVIKDGELFIRQIMIVGETLILLGETLAEDDMDQGCYVFQGGWSVWY